MQAVYAANFAVDSFFFLTKPFSGLPQETVLTPILCFPASKAPQLSSGSTMISRFRDGGLLLPPGDLGDLRGGRGGV